MEKVLLLGSDLLLLLLLLLVLLSLVQDGEGPLGLVHHSQDAVEHLQVNQGVSYANAHFTLHQWTSLTTLMFFHSSSC